MSWKKLVRLSLLSMVVLAALSVGATISLLTGDQKQSLLVVTSCMLGVSPVVLFHIYRREMLARDKLERSLEQSRQQYRRLLELSSSAVGVGRDGKLVEANEALRKLVGASADEVLTGKPLLELFAPSDREAVLERLQRASSFQSGTVWTEGRMLRLDGAAVDVEVAMLPALHEGGDAVQVVARDISERKRTEAAINRAREQAEIASRAKSQFLANISHEIRTPISGVIGMLNLLLATPLTTEQKRYLKMADSSADSLMTLLNDILDLSKVEAGKLDLIPVRFSVRECVQLAVNTLSVRAQEKGLKVHTRIADDVPSELVGDSARLRQVLLNVLGNAVKFTEEGSISLNVAVENAGEEDIGLRLSVADTGIGIPEAQQRRIFDAFAQADGSLTRRHSGVGLGLAISAHLVTLLGGRIWVESSPGKGSTFYFTVCMKRAPARAEVEVDSRLDRLAAAVDAPSGHAAPLDVLVAEDDSVNQKVAMVLLEKLGHNPTVVNNGADAVAAAAQVQYDLILMDIQMPGMDGFEATAAIRASEAKSGKHVPIVALTAHAMKGDEERCRQTGMDDYLSKPLSLDALRAKLHRWASRSGPARFRPAGAGR